MKKPHINLVINNRIFLLKKEMEKAVLLFLQAIRARELKILAHKDSISIGEFRDKFLGGQPAFAINLRAARKRRRLSQVQLAKMSGINRSNLNAYESGKKNVGKKVAMRLARHLKIDHRLLLNYSGASSRVSGNGEGIRINPIV